MSKDEKWIGELVGVFSDPIIVMPGGWGDTLPDWIREAITVERLISNIEALQTGYMTATDAEAVAYLYTASLEAPLDYDWTEIYLYVAGRVFKKHEEKNRETPFPKDLEVVELSNYRLHKLNHLKRWIYDQRARHRKERMREIKELNNTQAEGEKEAVIQHTFDFGLDT